jgi:tetratricopeptide (TPR) repeat protein
MRAVGGLLAAASVVWGLCGCGGPRFPVIRPVVPVSKEQVRKARAEEYFIKAREYDLRGLRQMAEHFYATALEFDPRSRVLRELLAAKYVESGKTTQALLVLKAGRDTSDLSRREKHLLSTVYTKLGQYQRAAAILEQIEDKGPEQFRALGLLYESAGDMPKAIESYVAAFVRKPASLDMGIKISSLMVHEQQYARAESLLVELRAVFGEAPELLSQFGLVSLAKGDTSGAENYYTMALAADSTLEDALRNLAQLFIQQNNYAAAIPYYRKLCTVQYWGQVYGRTLALLYYHNEQYEEAESLLKAMLVENIDDYELHYYLGLVALEREQHDLARLELEKAVAIHRGFEEAWRQLCFMALREKDWDEARDYAERYVKTLPEKNTAWWMVGYVLNARKEYQKAIVALRKSLELDSADANAWFEMGSSLERLKQIDRAAEAFRRVLALRPGDAVAANYLGYMWAERGMHLDSARALVKTALEKDPQNGAYLDSYAWVFYQMGDNEQAEMYIRKAVEEIDDDPIVLDILARKGDVAGALDAWEKSLELGAEDRKAILGKIEKLKAESGGE